MGRIIFIILVLMMWGTEFTVKAEQLDQEGCRNLRTQRGALVILGVKKHMEKGPEWALANLTQSELFQIKSYITVLDKLEFQCPAVKTGRKLKKAVARKPTGTLRKKSSARTIKKNDSKKPK